MRYLFLVIAIFYCTTVFGQYGLEVEDPTLSQADILYQRGNIDEALEGYQYFLSNNGDSPQDKSVTIARLGIASILIYKNDLKEAQNIIDDIRENKEQSLTNELQAYVDFVEGQIMYNRSLYKESDEIFEKGLKLASESGEKFRIAQLQYGHGRSRRNIGKTNEALRLLKNAATVFENFDKNYYLILAQTEIGTSQYYLGNTSEAEAVFLKAMNTAKDYDNKYALSYLYTFIAEFYKKTGDYRTALKYYNEQEGLLEHIGTGALEARVYNDIGAVYSFLNDGIRALEYYNRSREARKRAGLRPNAVTISNIALVHHGMGDLKPAEELYLEALEIFEEREEMFWMVKMNEFLADLSIDKNEPEVGIRYGKKAVDLVENYETKDLKAAAHLVLARNYTLKGDHEKALVHYKKSYENNRSVRGQNLVYALTNLSTAYYRAGSDSAFIVADEAFEEIEWLRGNISGDYLQSEIFRSYATFFFKVASWHIELNNDFEKAFEILEKGKSRSLLDQIAGSTSLDKFVDEATSLDILSKSKEIDRLYREFESTDDEKQRTELKNQINDAKLEYQLTINEAFKNNPEFNRLASPEIISLQETKNLLDKESAVIEFATFNNVLLTLIITKKEEKAIIKEIPNVRYSRRHLSKLVNGLREAIQTSSPLDSIKKYSDPLYNLLIEPIKANYPEIENLVLIPDVSLNYLPFEALTSPSGKFAIEEYKIKYLPSVSLFKYIPEPHRENDQELLAVAGSGFQEGNSADELRSQQSFASLPSTLMEVDSIATKFERVTLLKNDDVSEAGIKQLDLENYKYLHFATHGTVNEDDPSQSGLILSKRNDLEGLFGEDGLLNSAEISLLNINANLVVLSACNTGYGRNVVGEGLLGLQRAFLKAGASSVIVSLWSVYDKSTALMMADFYKKLNEYEEQEIGLWSKAMIWMNLYEAPMFGYKEQALRDAKLAMIEHPYYNHPVNWASFVLIGK